MSSPDSGASTSMSKTAGTTSGSPGAQNDSLQACLGRISASASAGTKQVAEESCRRDEAIRAGIIGTASAKSGDRAASGTQGDTLDACNARIPKDATAGQRMLAEESCKRDQENRR
jgi:hypothetical protein